MIIGNAQDLPNLRWAGISGARTLLAVCPDDAVNTEIVAMARADDELMSGRRPSLFARSWEAVGRDVHHGRRELHCLAQIADPNLCELLRVPDREGAATSSVDFFNTEETSAHLLLEKYPIDRSGAAPHMLVAHLDPLGRRLVLQAARKWHHKREDRSIKLVVSVIDDNAESRIRTFTDEHRALAEVCEFRPCSTGSADIESMVERYRKAGSPPIAYAYVTAHDDEQGLVTALKLHYTLESTTTTVVALSRAGGTSSLLEASGSHSFENVFVFPTLKETCTLSLLQGGSFEPLAKAIHEVWNDQQPVEKKVPWDSEAGELHRESSREQARAIPMLLRKAGCVITPLGDWSALDFIFHPHEIDTLAAAEHDRWMKGKENEGWTLGARDNDAKKHPDLVPFSQLSESSKDYNYETVRSFPKFVALAGLQVKRLEPAAQASSDRGAC